MRRTLRILCLWIAASLLAWPGLSLAADPQEPNEQGDVYRLVLLAPVRPVVIQVTVQVDGESLKGLRKNYAANLIQQYDADGDGQINPTEATGIPPLVKAASASETLSVSASWVSIDRSPADELVNVDELADWVDRVLGFPMSLAARPQRITQSIDVFGLLDLNHDARLSQTELQNAERSLHKLDLDEDDAFTVEELAPLQSERMRAAAQAGPLQPPADQPLLLLSDGASYSAASLQLIRRYSPTEATQPTALSVSAFGVDPAEVAVFDADHDGMLNVTEVTEFLTKSQAKINIHAKLPQARPGRPLIELKAASADAPVPTKEKRTDRLVLTTEGIQIEWRLQGARNVTNDNRDLFKNRFRMADQDKNGYISEQEFAVLGLPGAEFTQVDRNRDGMILVDEVMAFVNQESASSQSRIDLTLTHSGKSVFEVLDTDRDRRLSLREIRSAVELLRAIDLDGNGEISTAELVGNFRVVMELGKPAAFRNSGDMQNLGPATPIVVRRSDGPDWFIRMDRNRDGDVTRREFLGPRARFTALDANGDGLITAQEAESAE